jgi:hypothetical protein
MSATLLGHVFVPHACISHACIGSIETPQYQETRGNPIPTRTCLRCGHSARAPAAPAHVIGATATRSHGLAQQRLPGVCYELLQRSKLGANWGPTSIGCELLESARELICLKVHNTL